MAENDRLRAATTALHQKLDGISKQLSDFEARTRRLLRLRDDIRDYFRQRNEDSLEV